MRPQNSVNQLDSDSQFKLGVLYYNGLGCEQDDERASAWFTKAADQGHA